MNIFNKNFEELFYQLYINIKDAKAYKTNKYNIKGMLGSDSDKYFSTDIDANTKKYYIFSNIIYCKKNTNYTIRLESKYKIKNNTGTDWEELNNNHPIYKNKLQNIFLMKKFHFYETCLNGIQNENVNITDNATNDCNGAIINNKDINVNKVYAMRCDIVILNSNNMQIRADLNVSILQTTSIEPFSLYEGFNLRDLDHNFDNDTTPKSINKYYASTDEAINNKVTDYEARLNNKDYYIIDTDCKKLRGLNSGTHTECDNIDALIEKKDLFIDSINEKITSKTHWNNIPIATLKSNVNLNKVFDIQNINDYITEEQQNVISSRVPTFTPGGYSIYFKINTEIT